MKRTISIGLTAAAALLAGCVVTSVCPYYTESDVVFEPALVGDWVPQGKSGSEEVWKFDKVRERTYRFTLIEDQKASVMEAQTFKLQGQLFLDVYSLDQDIRVIPPHYLMKVEGLTPTLKFTQLNNDWLRKTLEQKPGTIAYHLVKSGDNADELRVVLTASTAELQKFVIQQLKNPDAWTEGSELTREPAKAKVQTTGKN